MLNKKINIIPRKHKKSIKSYSEEMTRKGFLDLHGELEITAQKNGKTFHYEKGENTVTQFAKHATMHLLSGESFTTWGSQRLFDTDDATAHTATNIGEGTNKDGTLLSGQQYFSTNSNPNFSLTTRWSQSTITPSTTVGDQYSTASQVKYPFFPSKLLFGTGFEFPSWTMLGTSYPDYQQIYINAGWDQPTFDGNISSSLNYFSNTFNGVSLTKMRSMNDIYTGALTTPTILDSDFAIPGTIKDGTYDDSSVSRLVLDAGGTGSGTIKTYLNGGNEFLSNAYAGIGNPCFIYARRESRFFQTGSEIQLSNDSNIENKITFTVVLPEQTGVNAGIFYPYNGYLLKVAGLFTDAKMLLANSVPTGTGDQNVNELSDWLKMPSGIMFAKRYISPITKSHDVSITARWTIYL